MVFSTMGADPSRPLMMTINVSFIMTCFPQIVIQNGGKNALWERRETGQWHRVKNLLRWWRLTVFLTTGIDSSLALRMTPCRPLSFWTESRKPWGKNGKRDSGTEWRIYYSEWHFTGFLTTATDPSRSLRM